MFSRKIDEVLEEDQFKWLFLYYAYADGKSNEPLDWFIPFQEVENVLIRESRRWGALFFTPKLLSNESLQG